MLHLLPIRMLMVVFAATVGLFVVGAFYAGTVNTGETFQAALKVVRWASTASLAALVLALLAWRWMAPVQRAVFPYLGGEWRGEVRYEDANGTPMAKPVGMEARHNLLGIKLLLDSDESTSTTLAVHAEKDPDFERYRLYYVYLNRRKEGVAGGGEVYRGLAVVRFSPGVQPSLQGDYFTETHRRGTLHLTQVVRTAFWRFWC